MSEIKFTKKENETVNKVLKTYADAMEANSHKYWTSNRQASKPYEDSLIGKKGEFFVAKYIKQQHGFEIKPDVEIYTSKKKNWSPIYRIPRRDTITQIAMSRRVAKRQ